MGQDRSGGTVSYGYIRSGQEHMRPSFLRRVFEMGDLCEGCAQTYYRNIIAHFENNEASIEFFKAHGVLLKELDCPNCGHKCTLREDQHLFRCHKSFPVPHKKKRRPCGFSVSSFKGSFLNNSHLEPWQVLCFMNFFCNKTFSHSEARINLQLSNHSTVDWRSFCSEVCENWVENQDGVGGEGVLVEIDETLIVRRKHNVGRVLSQVWLFGGIERVSKKRFVVPLMNDEGEPLPRNKETLIPLIQKFIRPGSTVYSDSWRAYNSLGEEGYRHWCVNHSVNFVDPIDKEIHTQNVERMWRDVKAYIRRPGIRPKYMKQYIARYLFLKNFKNQALHHLLVEAAKLYPPQSDRVRQPHPPLSPQRGSDDSDISVDLDEPRPSTSSE